MAQIETGRTDHIQRFLLAQLQIASLARKQNRREIYKALQTIPKDLNGIYDDAMQRIYAQDEDSSRLAIKVLSWVSCALRPLTVLELQHALARDSFGIGVTDSDIIDEGLFISVCAGLVIIDNESHIVRLVHYTAQEYFEHVRPDHLVNAEEEITITCLSYLSCHGVLESTGNSVLGNSSNIDSFPLLYYAGSNWGWHFQLASSLKIAEDVLRFINDEFGMRSSSKCLYTWENKSRRTFGSKVSPLHITAYFGLISHSKWLVDHKDVDPNVKNEYDQTPLFVCALTGQLALLDYLLGLPNIDVNSGRDTRSGTALHVAVDFEHVTIAKRLLGAGADVAAVTLRGCTPLHHAAEIGNLEITRLLIRAGSDCRAVSKSGTTPLYRGIRSGSLEILDIFLKEDGNINIKTWDSWTPLHEAVECDHTAIAHRLVEAGADQKIKTINGHTPLDMAEFLDRHHMVRLLRRVQPHREGAYAVELPLRPRVLDFTVNEENADDRSDVYK